MQLIDQLLEVSAFRPASGYSRDLIDLAKAGFGRKEAKLRWVALGRSEASFYKAYKVLKDDLIRLSFLDRKDSSEVEGRRLEVWEKYCVVKQLLVKQKKSGAIRLSKELLRKARKAGFTEVVAGLASLLENHYGAIEFDERRYHRYRILRQDYSQQLQDEMDVMALQAKLVCCLNLEMELSGLEEEIARLRIRSHGSYSYMRFRFSVLSLWADVKDDFPDLLSVFRETVVFFEHCEVELPVAVFTNLYLKMTPRLVQNGQYAEAEMHLSQAFRTIAAGTQGWHVLMLQKASLGLISGKRRMTKACIKRAMQVEDSHGNPELEKRWKVVQLLLEEGGELGFEAVWGEVFG